MVSEFLSKFITVKFYTSPSVSERKLSPVASTTALGVSAFVALAQTPTVGSMESTRPIASYPTSGPRSLLPSNTKHSCCNSRSMDNFQTAPYFLSGYIYSPWSREALRSPHIGPSNFANFTVRSQSAIHEFFCKINWFYSSHENFKLADFNRSSACVLLEAIAFIWFPNHGIHLQIHRSVNCVSPQALMQFPTLSLAEGFWKKKSVRLKSSSDREKIGWKLQNQNLINGQLKQRKYLKRPNRTQGKNLQLYGVSENASDKVAPGFWKGSDWLWCKTSLVEDNHRAKLF